MRKKENNFPWAIIAGCGPEYSSLVSFNKPGGTHGTYIRWLLILLCAHMEYFWHFDLMKVFGYIERVVKSDFFFEKYLLLNQVCATCSEQPSYIKTMAEDLLVDKR